MPGPARKDIRPDGPFAAALVAVRKLLAKAAAGSFFVNLLMLTGPIYMLQVYDHVLASRSPETLAVVTALVVGLFAAMAILDFARSALLARSGETFERELQGLTFDLAMDGARDGVKGAELPLKDLRQVRQFLASPALVAVFDAPWTPVFLAVVFLMHWSFGVVALLGMAALVALAVLNERMSDAATKAAQSHMIDSDRLVSAAFRNIAAADSMGMRHALHQRWSALESRMNVETLRAGDVIGGLGSASRAVRLLLQSIVLGVGALLVIRGEVSAGAMIAASIIVGRALAPVEIVTSNWRAFALARASFRRLSGHLGHRSDIRARTSLPAPSGALSVARLYVQPGGARKPVLKGVTFQLAPGEAVGVVGPSGAGKSTLGKALVGVERIASGEIRLDGAALDQWDRDDIGRHIGYLPQDVELFAGTAAQNISRFAPDADDRQILEAASAAGAHDMIVGFPDGYDTEVGEGGAYLSGGQRQRLGLARALYGAPALVVLDEPNSHLDADGDAALTAAIAKLKTRGATVIVIAHRASAVSAVDKILYVADGEVKAFGPRDEILRKIFPPQVAAISAAGGKPRARDA
jgi:PrtD family type I secretion system ABC transporter